MKNQYKTILLSCVLSVVLLTGCAGADNEEKAGAAAPKETNTESALEPEEEGASAEVLFEGKDMEGNSVSSGIFSESELTMVNVWATYCSPCLSEMPELGELAQEYDPKDFQLIGIVSDVEEGTDPDKEELVEVLIEQTGAAYPHLLVNESIFKGLLKDVTAVPTTFFFDREGKLLDTVVGAQ